MLLCSFRFSFHFFQDNCIVLKLSKVINIIHTKYQIFKIISRLFFFIYDCLRNDERHKLSFMIICLNNKLSNQKQIMPCVKIFLLIFFVEISNRIYTF